MLAPVGGMQQAAVGNSETVSHASLVGFDERIRYQIRSDVTYPQRSQHGGSGRCSRPLRDCAHLAHSQLDANGIHVTAAPSTAMR